MNKPHYFSISEFRCPCCGEERMDPEFLEALDRARALSSVPYRITSGYRCPRHDREIGGKGNHTTGRAADILCPDSRTRWHIVTGLFGAGFRRMGIGKNFIHVDACKDRPEDVIWLYGA